MSHLSMFAGLDVDVREDVPPDRIGLVDRGRLAGAVVGLGDLGFEWTEEKAPRRRRVELVEVDLEPLWPELPARLVGLDEQRRRQAARPFDVELDG